MISAVIITKNEEKNIGGCLDSVSWCVSELSLMIILVTVTVDIAKKKGVPYFHIHAG